MTKPFRVLAVLTVLLSCFATTTIANAKSGAKTAAPSKVGSDKKSNVAKQDEFVSLFNGKNLDGWVSKGGNAPHVVEDGMILGTSKTHTPNTFLCTTREYSDFILELEVKIDNELNSGIQVRSHCPEKKTQIKFKNRQGKTITQDKQANVTYGYQVEIDPAHVFYCGGIYDEARRGWLDNLTGEKKTAARKAFKRGEWNTYRVEAIGHSIKTWVNGVPAADITDEADASGFIGLQVHGVHGDEGAGKQVRWRNIRIKELTQ